MVTFEVKSINERKVNTKYGMKSAFDFIATDGSKYGFGFNNPSKYGITIGTKVTGNVTTGPYGMNLDKEGITVGGETSLSPTPTATTSGSFRGGAGAAGRPFPVPTTSGEMAIIRQNALTNAVATVADFVATQPSEKWPDLDTWTDMVITVAYKFAKFSSGQRETEAMKRLAGSGVAEAAELSTALDSALEEHS